MKELKHPTLIVVCGWPLSGKSSIAKILAERLGIHWVDIDAVRKLCVGIPYPHPDESEELMAKDRLEMKTAYELLIHNADIHLGLLRRSVIITATFSREAGQEDLARFYWREMSPIAEHRARIKVVQCVPVFTSPEDEREEIERRLSRGFGEGGYVGGVNSWTRYLEVKNRYQKIFLPHLEIDTSHHRTVEECAEEATAYILSEN